MNKLRLLSFVKFKKIQRVEAVIFGLFLLFLPVNLAKHFIFNFAYVDGILVDYLIPTIYLTDILIWGLLLLWLIRFLKCLWYSSMYCCTTRTSKPFVIFGQTPMSIGVKNEKRIPKEDTPLVAPTASERNYKMAPAELAYIIFGVGFVIVSGLSVLKALNQPAAVYKWLKLVEYILFAFYVSKHVDLKKDWPTIVKILSIGVLFESVLAIAQWFKQGSIFGYWFFGENKYTVSTPGVAILDFTGIRKARPYGTFPHPNVLGGYLAIILPWVLYVGVKGIKERGFYLLTFGLGLAALAFSFSRSAWVVGGLGILGVLGLTLRKKVFLSAFYLPSSVLHSLSFLRRAEFNWIALEIIKDHPLLGVGLNNFTVRMSEYGQVSGWVSFLQPVHNVYLLIAAEIGLLGLAAFLCLLFFAFCFLLKKKNYLLLVSLTQILLLCFVDHYFFTLQQTSLLFWLLIGLVFVTRDRI